MPRIARLIATMAIAATPLALVALGTASAQAKPTVYRGKTRDGDPIRFSVTKSRITKLTAYVHTLCLATEGLPMSGTDPFDPPGSFRIGHTTKARAKRPNAIWYTSDVTKNFVVAVHRTRGSRIAGKLHVDYSFLQILYTYPISARPYVCTGDTTFRLAPRK